MRITRLLFFLALCASSASAWDRVGHLVIDAIAWEHMDERARARAVELLRAAPADTDLALAGLDDRELFLQSGYWPDVVRDEAWPARKEKYDRPTWHYVNHFWRQDGTPLPELEKDGELLDRLAELEESVAGGIELAWLMHLMADLHQPLHSSGRVTDREPEGDRGGNEFTLDDPEGWGNLHGYWDSIQRRARRKFHSESFQSWIDRIAREITSIHPRSSLASEIEAGGIEAWSKDAFEIARAELYPSHLARDARPPRRYQDEAQTIADRQMALAGYRLAAKLNELFQ